MALSTRAHRVLGELYRIPDGITRDTNAVLSSRIGISVWEVSRAVSELARAGLVHVTWTAQTDTAPSGRTIAVSPRRRAREDDVR